MKKAVFLDKDGAVLENVPYNVNPHYIRLQSQAGEAIKLLKSAGYLIIIVTNQAGVARGIFPESTLVLVKHTMNSLLLKYGVMLDGFYYCSHHPDGTVQRYSIDCLCRMPMPGLIQQAVRDFNIDVTVSWTVGDVLNNIESGNRSGCNTILLNNGNEPVWETSSFHQPHHISGSILEAAQFIVQGAPGGYLTVNPLEYDKYMHKGN